MYNNLPENWIMRELKDFLDYEQPQKYIVSSTDYSEDYKTPVLTAGKSFVLGNTNETSGIYSDLPVIIFDDFTTASKYVDFPFKVKSSALKILKTNDSDLNLKYFSYFMQFNKFEPSTHKRYWISDYSKIKIAIPYFNGKPAYKEINYIVKTLDAVAEMIKLRKETIQLTKDLIPAIFQEMFGDPITNPKGWEMKALDNPDICVNCDSERRPITKSDRIKGIYPYYGASGIIDYVDDYIYDGSFLLIAEDGENLRSRSLPIAFSISGKAWVNNHAHVLKFKKHSSQLFIQTLFNNIDISAYITGAAQPKLNQNNLNKIKFPFPPLPLQDEFANKVEQINQNLKIQQEDLDRLEELFDQLLQKAFTGELTRGDAYGKH